MIMIWELDLDPLVLGFNMRGSCGDLNLISDSHIKNMQMKSNDEIPTWEDPNSWELHSGLCRHIVVCGVNYVPRG